MNTAVNLVVLGLLAAANARSEPVEDLRLEIQTLTQIIREQQTLLTKLAAKSSDQRDEEPAYYDEYGVFKKPGNNQDLSTADLDLRISELEKRVDEAAEQTHLRFGILQKDIENSKYNVEDAALAYGGNIQVAAGSKLRHMVATYVNESLRQQFDSGSHDLSFLWRTKECQSGTFGTKYFHGIQNTYPRIYNVTFEPVFKKVPKFTYGMIHLDAKSIVRVNVKVTSLKKDLATVEVETWNTKHIYGVELSWMACP